LASSSSKEKTKTHTHKEKKNAKKGGTLPFFSRFYIWNESFFLLSPLHIPSTLSSPPSSSLGSHNSLKLCAIQAWEMSPTLEME
jgi:hypothetical protein